MKRTILMLEHDDDDRYITQATFDDYQLNVEIKFVSDSDQLMDYLAECAQNQLPLPSVILLNYQSTPLNAVGLLKNIKSKSEYRHIPVVVLCGTAHPDIVRECYLNGANSFIQKPSAKVETKILSFVRYWFETVQLV